MMDTEGTEMQTSTSTMQKQILTRVTQGVMLGTVLTVPVALWAYTKAAPSTPVVPEVVSSSTVKAPRRANQVRKPMRVVRKVPTIPASQMHTLIDGGHPSASPTALADN